FPRSSNPLPGPWPRAILAAAGRPVRAGATGGRLRTTRGARDEEAIGPPRSGESVVPGRVRDAEHHVAGPGRADSAYRKARAAGYPPEQTTSARSRMGADQRVREDFGDGSSIQEGRGAGARLRVRGPVRIVAGGLRWRGRRQRCTGDGRRAVALPGAVSRAEARP